MPTSTFFNLPAEKRDQIIEVAIDEFAANDYDGVSISRIVARAGIAKGSFYQYFADKDDLYGYLLGLLVEAKKQFFALDHPDLERAGVFGYLRWTAERGAAFELSYPRLCQIGYRTIHTRVLPHRFQAMAAAESLDFYRRLVEIGQQRGDIAPGIDPALAASLFDLVMSGLGRLIAQRVQEFGFTAGADLGPLFDLPEVQDIYTQTIGILEYGMRCAPGTPPPGGWKG